MGDSGVAKHSHQAPLRRGRGVDVMTSSIVETATIGKDNQHAATTRQPQDDNDKQHPPAGKSGGAGGSQMADMGRKSGYHHLHHHQPQLLKTVSIMDTLSELAGGSDVTKISQVSSKI